MTHEPLLRRIRAEYREMPGLRLTTAQACRLWQLDAKTCETVLARLLDEHFLHCTRDGAYVAFPETRPYLSRHSLPGATRREKRPA
jgi:hypothetical protein